MQDRLAFLMSFIKQLGPVKLAITAIMFIAFIILFSIYVFRLSASEMGVLYTGLESVDSGRITAELDSKNIPYVVENNGATIRVPEAQVLRTRVLMAGQGLPSHGSMVGYEIFDKEETLGTTNFLQNVKLMRALEGELTRTIGSFESVAKVRVHLVIPQREVFSKDRQEPRASVILRLKNKKVLGKNEIAAISHLMATAVPGLEVKNITIVDTSGKSLKLGGDEEGSFMGAGASTAADEYRSAFENRLTQIVEDLLAKSLGSGKVRARVSAEMNFDRTVTNAEIYDGDGAVLRSVQTIEEKESTPMGGGDDNADISAANNLPGAGGADAGGGGGNAATVERTDETKNYEISKTVRSEIIEAGTVQKLSVAVLIDGVYKKDATTGEMQYTPRTQEELTKIENLVKAAIGFKAERKDTVEIVNMPFMNDLESIDDEANWLKEQIPFLFQSLILAVIVMLVFLTVIRPLTLKLLEASKNAAANSSPALAAAAEQEIEVSLVDQKSQTTAVRKVSDVMVNHPEEALMVIRRWLNTNGS